MAKLFLTVSSSSEFPFVNAYGVSSGISRHVTLTVRVISYDTCPGESWTSLNIVVGCNQPRVTGPQVKPKYKYECNANANTNQKLFPALSVVFHRSEFTVRAGAATSGPVRRMGMERYAMNQQKNGYRGSIQQSYVFLATLCDKIPSHLPLRNTTAVKIFYSTVKTFREEEIGWK